MRSTSTQGKSAQGVGPVPLSEALDAGVFGGKAAGLARALAMGAPVPGGLALGAEVFEEHLDLDRGGSSLGAEVDELLARVTAVEAGDWKGLGEIAESLRSRIVAAEIEAGTAERIRVWVEEHLGDVALAVRSSAIGEDGEAASFAGQLDSCLGVRGEAALFDAIRTVWASRFSARALAYGRRVGKEPRGVGVVLQPMVDARCAGVLFTVDPAPSSPASGGAPGEEGPWMALEWCGGLGDGLVAGDVEPGRAWLHRGSERVTLAEDLDRVLDADARLSGGDFEFLRVLGESLEVHFGQPLDLEWALDRKGAWALLQARPITTLGPEAGSSNGEAPKDEPRDEHPGGMARETVRWTNANVDENFPEPLTPLLWSVVEAGYSCYFHGLARAFGLSAWRRRGMETPLRRVVGVHGGRLYYNLTNIHAALRMAPAGEALAGAFNRFVGAEGNPVAPSGTLAFRDTRGLARGVEYARVAGSLGWRWLRLGAGVRRFEKRVDTWCRGVRGDLANSVGLDALLGRLEGFFDIRRHRWTDAAMADAAAMVGYGALHRLLSKHFPGEDESALHNTLLKGIPGVPSGEPVLAIWKLSRIVAGDPQLVVRFGGSSDDELVEAWRGGELGEGFGTAFGEYLSRFGFRRSGELLLTVPSFEECPGELMGLVRAYLRVEGESPADVQARQDQERRVETERVLSKLAGHRLWARLPGPSWRVPAAFVLKFTHRGIVMRERARFAQAKLYGSLRCLCLGLGERLVERGMLAEVEDVFYLKAEELVEVGRATPLDPTEVRASVERRRRVHREQGEGAPPDDFELPAGEAWCSGASGPSAGERSHEVESGTNADTLEGTGACGGSVTARAAVLEDLSEAGLLESGDILVTKQTDPGWGPLFFLIRGLVIERGGMLSHGAILAREYGLPTVVGIPMATARLRTGDRLEVDGDRGRVRVLGR